LADKGIITKNGKEGKRGIRVYPPWDIATNKQAEKTQRWQMLFLMIFFSAIKFRDIKPACRQAGKGFRAMPVL
jgi:hypothetical protein